jgi:hypothetical protein
MSHARSGVARAIQGLAQELVNESETLVSTGDNSQKGSLFTRFRFRIGA